MGGATLDEPIKEGEGLKINGSVMMVEADTREEVEKAIKEDIYYKEGVWDADKVSPLLRESCQISTTNVNAGPDYAL